LLTEAVVQQRYHGISDPDQEWVLRELIHYLSTRRRAQSDLRTWRELGAGQEVRHEDTLRTGNPAARDVAERWSSSRTTSR